MRFIGATAECHYAVTHYSEMLMLKGLIPSAGIVERTLDNALCEMTIGPYKTECVRNSFQFRSGSIRTLTDLENIVSATHCLGRRPSAVAEADYYAWLNAGKARRSHITRVCRKPRTLHSRLRSHRERIANVNVKGSQT